MNRTFLTLVLLLSFSAVFSQGIGEVKKEINPGEFNFTEVYGSTGEVAFAGDIKDGALTFGVFSAGSNHFESVQKVTMVNSKNKRVTIKNAFASQQGLIIVGEIQTKFGVEQYLGRIDDAESKIVEGVYFNTVNTSSKTPIHELKYHYSKVSEKIGVTYFTEEVKTKETIVHVAMANLSGDVELSGSLPFFRHPDHKISDLELEVFMGRFNGLAIGFFEVAEKGESKTMQSTVALFQTENKKALKHVILEGEQVIHSLRMSQGLDNSILVTGFFGVEESKFMNIYSGNFNVEELNRINEIKVQVEQVDLYPNELFSEEKDGEPVLWDDYKIKTTKVSEAGIIGIYAYRNNVEVSEESGVIQLNKDQMFLRVNEGGGLEQSYMMPYRQFIEGVEESKISDLKESLENDYSEKVFVTGENLAVLYKRPNFDKRMDLKVGETYFPLLVNFNIIDGVFEDMKPPFRDKLTADETYLRYYVFSSRKVNR